MKTRDNFLVGVDFSRGPDVGILIVGKKNGDQVDLINFFQGDEAYNLYKKLVTKKAKTKEKSNASNRRNNDKSLT